MASRTAQLIAQLVDRVSGPAKGMAGALDGVAVAGKRLGKGVSTPALDKLTKDLKDAQAQAEKLAQLQGRMKTLGTSRTAFNGARQDLERISRELEAARKLSAAGDKETARSVRTLEREQARARASVRSAASAFEAEAEAAKRLRRELAALGVPMTSLASAQSSVAAKAQAAATALDRQTRAEKRARAADALAAQAHEAGAPGRRGVPGGLGVVGGRFLGAGAAAYTAAAAYKQAAAFDRRITMIGQTADAARPQIDRLGASVHDLAQGTATPVDRLVGGLEALVAQGRSLQEAMDFLPSVARTAAATGSEVDDIAKSADSVGSNFNIAGKEMQAAFDIMAAGGKAGQFELKDMARYLPSLSPAAKAVGFAGQQGLSDIVAMLQVIRKGAGSSEEAATSLTNIFQKMESEETVKRFKKMGVDLEAAMKKGRKEGRNLIEVFEEAANQALKGDLSKLPNLIADQEFGRGVRALMTYRGEWQKLSATIRATSAGTVAKDLEQVTKDSQSALDRLSNSAQRAGQAGARFMDSAFGTSDRIQGVAKGLEATAQAIERINEAYSKGGLLGVGKFLKDLPGDAAREKLAETLPERKKEQAGQIKAIEDDIAATERTMRQTGRSQEQIDGVLRSKRAALAAAKRAQGDLDMETAGFRKDPPSMLQDPTAPIQGQTGPIGQGGGSRNGTAFNEAFPIDLSGRKPMPAVTPLPPRRPASVPTLYGNVDDAFGPGQTIAPKVDTSQVEGAQTKIDELGTKMDEVGQKTIAPPVNSAPVDSLIEKLGRALGLISQVNSGAEGATARVNALTTAASNAGGAMGRTGRVAQAFANSPSAGEA